MRIALIDNGIDKKLVDYEEEIDFSQRDMERSVRDEKYNHGTVCAAIIAKYAPGSNIISLKAIETVGDRCSVQYIRRAILYCIENKIELISMSVGTRDAVSIANLYNIIREALKVNILVVASGSRNCKVYPAAFCGVVYVDINDAVNSRDMSSYIEDCPNGLKAYIASGTQEVLFKNGERFVTPNYSSFAVPVIASILHNYMAEGYCSKDAINQLKIRSRCLQIK